MFMESLNDTVLAFIYPTDGTRTFHTFFCPPMWIIALSAEGQAVFDEVITKHHEIDSEALRISKILSV